MNVLSVDVGTKNLAVCQIDRASNTLLEWRIERIECPKGKDLLQAVYEAMERLAPSGYDVALVEKQPTNRQMIRVEAMIAMYLKAQRSGHVALYSPVHKLGNVEGACEARGKGRKQYAARKRLSVEAAKRWLEAHPQSTPEGSELVRRFEAATKQDDFADSLMQALSYCPQAGTSQPSPAKVVCRKPTAKQLAKQSFSLSNLKWLITEALKEQARRTCVDIVVDSDVMRMLRAMHGSRPIAAALRLHGLTATGALERLGFLCPSVEGAV